MIGNLGDWFAQARERAHVLGLPVSVSIEATEPQHARGGRVLDLDGDRVVGQFIVWPNGAVEMSALEVETAERFLFKDATVQHVTDLDGLFDELVRAQHRLGESYRKKQPDLP